MPAGLDQVERMTERVRGLAFKLKTFPRGGDAESTYYGIRVDAETHAKISKLVYDDLLQRYETAKRELQALLQLYEGD